MVRCIKNAGTPIILAAALLLTAVPVHAQEQKREKGADIDVVICLDVSGSMQGLFGSAKLKLWDIVNDLGKVKPTPNLRVGLYSYGHSTYDANGGWVRKEIDLTTDLDEVYRKLNALTIRGGQEYVGRVCRDAIQDQKWSQEKNALKVIFVCGNEPAAQDPLVKLKDVGDLALKNDVVINPIYCGAFEHADARDWKEFAAMAKGRFSSIDQNKGTVAIVAPQDKDITALSAKLNETYLAYGKEGMDRAKNQYAQDANAEKTSPGAAASRGVAKAGGLYRNDSWDLVDRFKIDPKFDIKKIPEAELCDTLKKLKPEEREKYVKDMLAKREDLQKQILELNKQREDYIRTEMKKNSSKADKVFDEAVRGALREQGSAKGIKIPD